MDHRSDLDDEAFLSSYDASRYPRPSVAVDVVLLTVVGGRLATLLVRRSEQPQRGSWALPGGFVQMNESLDAAAHRVLAAKAGLRDIFIEQLYSFGALNRDPRTRVISIAYYALVEADRLEPGIRARDGQDVMLATIDSPADRLDELVARDPHGATLDLAFDHAEIVAVAIKRIQAKLDYAPIGFELLPDAFTLRDLRLIHESILGQPLNKDSFRRKILDRGLVAATGERASGLGHRPPMLYRFNRSEGRRA